MTCQRFDLGNGDFAIACTRGSRVARCKPCDRKAVYLCDWKLKGAKLGKTCDAKLCQGCAQSPAPDKHLCQAHWRLWEQMKAETKP